jgi:DNA methylase
LRQQTGTRQFLSEVNAVFFCSIHNVTVKDDVRPAGSLIPVERSGRRIAQRLSSVGWDFSDADADRQSIHSFHSYPAKFIPEIPRVFIRELPPPPGTIIFDPFCGCGTTLVEAQSAGYASVGVDVNPIGCLITSVKTTPLPWTFMAEAETCLNRAREMGKMPSPKIPNLDHWFRLDITQALAALRAAIQDVKNRKVQQALEGVFSSIVVRVSNQDSDTRYAAVTKPMSAARVFDLFNRAAESLAASAIRTKPGTAIATVINRSIFDVQASDIPADVGLVVTSPPYPNAYEYWLYHKYRMWWLGYDPLAVKADEIGARAHFFSGRRHEQDFHAQMSKLFALLSAVTRKSTYCCFVIGDSKIHGEVVDNCQHLENAARAHGFKLVFKVDREINPYRKSFNLHHARIKREHVLVWER